MEKEESKKGRLAESAVNILNAIKNVHVLIIGFMILPVTCLFAYFMGIEIRFWEMSIVPYSTARQETVDSFIEGSKSFISVDALADISGEHFQPDMSTAAIRDTLENLLERNEKLIQDFHDSQQAVLTQQDIVAHYKKMLTQSDSVRTTQDKFLQKQLAAYQKWEQHHKYTIFIETSEENKQVVKNLSHKLAKDGFQLACDSEWETIPENKITFFSKSPETKQVAEEIRKLINSDDELMIDFSEESALLPASMRQKDILIQIRSAIHAGG